MLKTLKKAYIVNYDFGCNWGLVLEHIGKPKVQDAMNVSICKFMFELIQAYPIARCVVKEWGRLKNLGEMLPFNVKNIPPSDNYNVQEYYVNQLVSRGIMPQEYLEMKAALESLEPDTDKYDELMLKLNSMDNDMIRKHFPADREIYSYIMWQGCHSQNLHFGYTLAKSMFSDVDWVVITTKTHTTMVSRDFTKMFDMLAWSWEDRVWQQTMSMELSNKDGSFGARECVELLCD